MDMEHKTDLQLKSEQITRLQNRVTELTKENKQLKEILRNISTYANEWNKEINR